MAEHPPEYEYRVTYEEIRSDGMFHANSSLHKDEAAARTSAAWRRRRDDHRNVVIERRFIGPWHAMCDGDEAPAADRRLAVMDVVVTPPGPGGGDGIGVDVFYRGLRGVHEITPLIGTTSTRVEFDLDNPPPEPF